MSLNWSIEKCKNYKELWEEDKSASKESKDGKPVYKLTGVTNSLIWSSLSIGLSSITEKNVGEWYARLKVQEAVHGKPMVQWQEAGEAEEVGFTISDVLRHVGMSTNVTTTTRSQFLKGLARGMDSLAKEATERLSAGKSANGESEEVVSTSKKGNSKKK